MTHAPPPNPSSVSADFAVVARPSFLFAAAFALSISPHELAHGLVAFFLGFDVTLYQMWVYPEAASARPSQLVLIALAGPLFSLLSGLLYAALYVRRYRNSPPGLIFLFLSSISLYSFLGPLVGAAFGGDFNAAARFLSIPWPALLVFSILGAIALPVFLFFVGRELSRWAPPRLSRWQNVLCTVLAPWILGTSISLWLYRPLPQYLQNSSLFGSAFWLFAVLGAALGYPRRRPAPVSPAFIPADYALFAAALLIVRALVQGIHLSH